MESRRSQWSRDQVVDERGGEEEGEGQGEEETKATVLEGEISADGGLEGERRQDFVGEKLYCCCVGGKYIDSVHF